MYLLPNKLSRKRKNILLSDELVYSKSVKADLIVVHSVPPNFQETSIQPFKPNEK